MSIKRFLSFLVIVLLVCFFGCVRELRPETPANALYAFERETAFMVSVGNLRAAQGRIEAFLDTTAAPTSDYGRRVRAYLLLRLGYTYHVEERWSDVQRTYVQAGPYLQHADTTAQIRFYRWASSAYARAGNRNQGLTMIHRSMYLADAIRDSTEFEKSRACWRLLAADSIMVADHPPVATSTMLFLLGSALLVVSLYLMAAAGRRPGRRRRPR